MIPWWWLLLTALVLPGAAMVLFAVLALGDLDGDMTRLADLEGAVERAFVALLRGNTAEATKTLRDAMAREGLLDDQG